MNEQHHHGIDNNSEDPIVGNAQNAHDGSSYQTVDSEDQPTIRGAEEIGKNTMTLINTLSSSVCIIIFYVIVILYYGLFELYTRGIQLNHEVKS